MKLTIMFFAFLIFSPSTTAKEIHKERSIYRNVVIVEEGDLRCMRFETRRKKIANQACIDLNDPERLVFEYSHGIMAGYALNPNPKRILILGLGGGVISKFMHDISPQAEIISVDIDPVVVKLATQYFGYTENAQVKTEIKDGRVYVKRAILNNEKFDWIILDAFNGDYIPEHLMTREFLQEVKSLLNPNGIIAANTFSGSELFHYESVTYQKVFNDLLIFQAPTKGNRVIFGCNCTEFKVFPAADDQLRKSLSGYQINVDRIWDNISNEVNWDESSDFLTDQYSPANLLKQTN